MKPKKIFKYLIFLVIILFIFSYVIEKSGYYEYNLQRKKIITEEAMKRFEKDAKRGKDIDINNYLKDSEPHYSNKLTDMTSSFSINLNKYLKNSLTDTFKILSKLIK